MALLALAASFSLNAHAALLVSNFLGDTISRFDANSGAYLGEFATTAGGVALNGPYGIQEGSDGYIYAGDFLNARIVRYTADGDYVDTVVSGYRPHSFTFGPDDRLYVNDIFGANVRAYDPNNGFAESIFVGSGSGGLFEPRDLVFGANGDLYVTSNASGNEAVLQYDGLTGAPVGAFTSGAVLDKPRTLAFGIDGNLYVESQDDNQILRYDPFGNFLDVFVSPGEGGLMTPNGFAFGPDGNFYVASRDSDQILRYDSNGQFIDIFIDNAGTLDGPSYLYFTSDSFAVPVPGALWLFVSGLGMLIVRVRTASKAV